MNLDLSLLSASPMEDHEIAESIGEPAIGRIVEAFYRQVQHDDVIGPMYPQDDLQGAADRLTGFLVFRFGGSQRYLAVRGSPRLRMRHAPFTVDQFARDRWYQLMDRAITESDIPESAASCMRQFFEHTATFLINQAAN